MKVFNITDASTAALRNRGLENQHIKVGETIIPPGGSAVLRGTAKERSELQVYLKVGAVAMDELPVVYASKRGLSVQGDKLVQDEPKLVLPPMPNPLNEESVTRRIFTQELVEEESETPKKRGR